MQTQLGFIVVCEKLFEPYFETMHLKGVLPPPLTKNKKSWNPLGGVLISLFFSRGTRHTYRNCFPFIFGSCLRALQVLILVNLFRTLWEADASRPFDLVIHVFWVFTVCVTFAVDLLSAQSVNNAVCRSFLFSPQKTRSPVISGA